MLLLDYTIKYIKHYGCVYSFLPLFWRYIFYGLIQFSKKKLRYTADTFQNNLINFFLLKYLTLQISVNFFSIKFLILFFKP